MTHLNNHDGMITHDLFEKVIAEIGQLRGKSSDHLIASLAREVIDRLASEVKGPKDQAKTVLSLTAALVGPDPAAPARLINDLDKRGLQVNELYLDYLAPAAKKLGTWWEEDEITFTEVALGIGRIYAIMRTFSSRIVPPRLPASKSALFASIPGNNHTLGVKMAADLARKEGWKIDVKLDLSHEELIRHVHAREHLLIGLSGGGLGSLQALAQLVLALRISAPNARILVSGNIAEIAPESIRLMQVDGISRDYNEAMRELNRLWGSLVPA